MRLQIITEDNTVIKDGVYAEVLNLDSMVPENLHALQWYETFGEEEYTIGNVASLATNVMINNLDDYKDVLIAYDDAIANPKVHIDTALESAIKEAVSDNINLFSITAANFFFVTDNDNTIALDIKSKLQQIAVNNNVSYHDLISNL